jgi:putative hemolysin
MMDKGSKKAGKVLEILENLPDILAPLIVGLNTSMVIASCVTTAVFERFHLLASIVLTFVMTIFGELIPKSLSRLHSMAFALNFASPLVRICKIIRPLSNIILRITDPLTGRTKDGPHKKHVFLSKEELRLLVEEGRENGALRDAETKMLNTVFKFSRIRAGDIMTPRVEMVTVDAEVSFDEVLLNFERFQYSRIPVYDETVDDIVGIIYVKDLLNFWDKPTEDLTAVDLIRLPYFVPITMRLDCLLQELRKRKLQIAVVVDEYGGTAGIVTLEDVLEELVGEIQDEYDFEESPIKIIKDGTYLVPGKIEISVLNEELHLDLPSETFSTLNGLILDLVGKIPAEGETIRFHDIIFAISQADRKSIQEVTIYLPSKKDKSPEKL